MVSARLGVPPLYPLAHPEINFYFGGTLDFARKPVV